MLRLKRERKPNIILKIFIRSQGREQKKRKEREKNCKNKQKTSNNVSMNIYIYSHIYIYTHLSKIPIYVNGLNASVKRHRVTCWTQKQVKRSEVKKRIYGKKAILK